MEGYSMNYGGSIDFAHNWNGKLFCRNLTTLRLRNDDLYKINHWYMLALNDGMIGPGIIIDIKHYKLSQLNEFIARIESGLSLADCKDLLIRRYRDKKINWLTQDLSFILIDHCEMHIPEFPLELYGTHCENWPNKPQPAIVPEPEQTNLFTK
jgi:hypothetical protein